MATKFVFNPFTGNFDAIDSSTSGTISWPGLDCGIPDYIEGRPVVLASDGSLKTADMVTATSNNCRVTDGLGNTLYSGTLYFPI